MKTQQKRFDRLVASYYPAIFQLAAKFSVSQMDAVALTRRTFERAAKTLPRFRRADEIEFLLLASMTNEAGRLRG